MRIAIFAYAADGGCWNLTRSLNLVGADAVNCVTSLNYLDYPHWFDVSKEAGRAHYRSWLSDGCPDVVIFNKYHIWEMPYPIRIQYEEAKYRVIWHRGTAYRNDYEKINAKDKAAGLIRMASTLDLLQYDKTDLHWFPPPVSVEEYASFKKEREDRLVRFFHSPTVREKKGTKEFLECIEELRHESPDYDNLQLVLAERVPHRSCMEMRGACDMVFDQAFDMCYGNSGLEACCMKMPVIANAHPKVYDELRERNIEPWFVDPGFNDKQRLKDCIKELYNDPSLRKKMGQKGYEYVKAWHDLRVCGERFLSIINVA